MKRIAATTSEQNDDLATDGQIPQAVRKHKREGVGPLLLTDHVVPHHKQVGQNST